MIVEWLLDFVLSLVITLVELVAPVGLTLGDVSGGLTWMMAFNVFLPLDTMLAGGLLLMAVRTTWFFFNLTRALIAHVPWIGGAGA